jgi:hypothetical protein
MAIASGENRRRINAFLFRTEHRRPCAVLCNRPKSWARLGGLSIVHKTKSRVWRIKRDTWQPHTFAAGKYTVRVSVPETGKAQELRGLEARAGNDEKVEVDV